VNAPRTADVVVIGGGAVGCSIAYHLARRGVRDVVVLERETVGSGTTSKAAGAGSAPSSASSRRSGSPSLLLEQGRVAEAEAIYRSDLGLDGKLSRACQHPDNLWSSTDCTNA
jgi:glycine/D-amino acid oxidase-like deaminating enzyme